MCMPTNNRMTFVLPQEFNLQAYPQGIMHMGILEYNPYCILLEFTAVLAKFWSVDEENFKFIASSFSIFYSLGLSGRMACPEYVGKKLRTTLVKIKA